MVTDGIALPLTSSRIDFKCSPEEDLHLTGFPPKQPSNTARADSFISDGTPTALTVIQGDGSFSVTLPAMSQRNIQPPECHNKVSPLPTPEAGAWSTGFHPDNPVGPISRPAATNKRRRASAQACLPQDLCCTRPMGHTGVV